MSLNQLETQALGSIADGLVDFRSYDAAGAVAAR